MRGWWWWLFLAFFAWKMVMTSYWALARPWRWDVNQILFAFFLACVTYVVVFWSVLWLRGGKDAVRQRWARVKSLPQAMERVPRKSRTLSLVFWIVIALVLVFVFNLLHRPG
jgi:hypothetical protein